MICYGTYGELTTTTEYSKTTPIIRFLYNGQFGVVTDDNGLYYMRSRYYNPEIKRFINQDVLMGSIVNSNSLNRYSYVEGNPISYTDPFGLSPYQWISAGIHTGLDFIGIFVPGADIINAFYYLFEGNPTEFAKSLIYAIPGSDFVTKGSGFLIKLGKNSDEAVELIMFFDKGAHIAAPMLAAYDTGSLAGAMIDKYLVNEAELSAETAVEAAFLVLGGYQAYRYADMLSGSILANGATDIVTPDASNIYNHYDTSAEMYGGVAESGSKTFYTVQGPEDINRLLGGGTPWPTEGYRANLGDGVYAWGSLEDAQNYWSLRSRRYDDLQIIQFEISLNDLDNMNTLDLTIMSDDEVNDFLSAYSRLNGQEPNHGYDYIMRNGHDAIEHYFNKTVFDRLKFQH